MRKSRVEEVAARIVLKRIAKRAAELGAEVYVVGGYVRDALLRRSAPPVDVDLVVTREALQVSRRAADDVGGGFFVMDEVRGVARIILVDDDGRRLNLDVSDMRGGDIMADLGHRDFTANAMAWPLERLEEESAILDPHRGRSDLGRGLLRAVSPAIFRCDPNRLLRAVRLASELGWEIEPRTLSWLRRDALYLREVSRERIRDELMGILKGDAWHGLRLLDDFGMLEMILPELGPAKDLVQGFPHHLDVFDHSMETVLRLEEVGWMLGVEEGDRDDRLPRFHGLTWPYQMLAEELSGLKGYLGRHLLEVVSGDRPRWILTKLVALLHDVGKPATSSKDEDGRHRFIGHEKVGEEAVGVIFRRLRFSMREARLAKIMTGAHMRPLQLAREGASRRAIRRFFRDTGGAGVEVVILSMADHLATLGRALRRKEWHQQVSYARAMLEHYYSQVELAEVPRLVSGDEVMERLGLSPGPKVGWLLGLIQEAQDMGEISSREEALDRAEAALALEGGRKR
jgi:tRNA nucleotidyltransferase/poly(A) polymerase